MTGELKGSRTITPEIQDYMTASEAGVSIDASRVVSKQLAESEIAVFCGGCDFFRCR